MYVPDIELHRPSTLDQAGALLQQRGLDARLLVGQLATQFLHGMRGYADGNGGTTGNGRRR